MVRKRDIFFLLLGFLLSGCAAFAYKYYGLDGVSYENGTLLGPTSAEDKPFKNCEPSSSDKHPCVVMFRPEFFALKQDHLSCLQALKDCQAHCP